LTDWQVRTLKRRSATRISTTGDRGLKPTATVTKSLRAGDVATPVLRGVTLEIVRGEFVAVVGPSGCGKTTLLSLLAALDRADGGRLVVAGVDLVVADAAALDAYRRDTIGVVLQFYNLLPSLTALENVETCLELVPLAASVRRARAMEALDEVGLANAAGKFPAQMSGGMQQRVAIARALAKRPALLLADEPTGNLDPQLAIVLGGGERKPARANLGAAGCGAAERGDRLAANHDVDLDGANPRCSGAERELHAGVGALVLLAAVSHDQPEREREGDRSDPATEQIVSRHGSGVARRPLPR